MPTPAHRSDIDGLRALAVLSVVIFHIHEHLIPGGFVGVDIFFVISGFLISLQLYKQISEGVFSLKTFYTRRIKRIVPAVTVVTLVTTILSALLFTPGDAKSVSESAIWSTLSLGNAYFWKFQDTSYFAKSSLETPLLHLWSLGVEEQFYMVWPLVLMLFSVCIMRWWFGILIACVILVSATLGEYLYHVSHSFTYYMLPTRAGELLVGALVAFFVTNGVFPDIIKRYAVWFQVAGIALIIWALFTLSNNSVFPGYYALIPTVGTGLLLLGGHYANTIVSKVLSNPLFVFFGLISYSLYLWHWPILAFFRYSNTDIDLFYGLLLFVAMIVVSYASYRWVETPFRKRKDSFSRVFVNVFVLPSIVVILVCLVVIRTDGYFVANLTLGKAELIDSAYENVKETKDEDHICQSKLPTEDDYTTEKCVTGDTTAISKRIILLGDSNAAQLVNTLTVLGNKEGFSFRNISVNSCPPLIQGFEKYAPAKRISDCANSVPKMFELSRQYDVVIIAASWSFYKDINNDFIKAFAGTINEISTESNHIIIFGKIPDFDKYDRACLQKSVTFPYTNCKVDDVPVAANILKLNASLESIADTNPNVSYIEINDLLCTDGLCSMYNEDGEPIYFDFSHLSTSGATYIGNKWIESLKGKSPIYEIVK